MGVKGKSSKSDALEVVDYNHLIQCLRNDKLYLYEIFCRLSYWMALRVSDVKKLKWIDILYVDQATVREGKTGKERTIPFKPEIRAKILEIHKLMSSPDLNRLIFLNDDTGRAYTTKHFNEQLSRFKVQYRVKIGNFSTHTFRKTFGRDVWNQMGRTEYALLLLNRIFRHANIETTTIYLGLRPDEITEAYSLTSAA